jgi:sarcosine oxidase
MSAQRCDVAVVGLGAFGSAALMHLAKSGMKVIGIDRFSPPHEMGSSHGETRVTREAIAEGGEYINCALRSHELWREIESQAQVSIFTACGGLLIDASPNSTIHGVTGFGRISAELARQRGIAHEVLSVGEAKRRFPGFAINEEAFIYFEPGAGFVRPEVAIEAQLRLAQQSGAVVHNNTPVLAIERLPGGGVKIITPQTVIEAGSCLLTAGAWISQLLPGKAGSIFTVTRQVLHWLPIKSNAYHADSSPVFVWCYGESQHGHVYGFPSLDGATVKIATELFTEVSSPELTQRVVSAEEQAKFYQEHIVGRFTDVSGPPVRSKVCLYTEAPQGRFVIERHPDIAEVLVASCCSGHGFKHSAAVGEALATTLRGVTPTIDLGVFRRAEWGN